MKRHAKSVVALALGAILPPGLPCQTTQAQGLLNESGASILADVFGTAAGSEALTVNWSVVENASGIYTYTYTVNNPSGDVLLNGNDTPTVTPEIVDSFELDFNATLPGAVVSVPTGGDGAYTLSAYGLCWVLNPDVVLAGASSGRLSFESDNAPTPGNASASDDNPPSPWSSCADGQPVPVPDAPSDVPEPTTTALLALTALLLPPFGSARRLPAATASTRQYCRPRFPV
jgi:hypothetical protein